MIRTILIDAIRKLGAVTDTPRLDAELLLMHVLGQRREYLIAHDTDTLSPQQIEQFDAAVEERMKGVPIPYLTGSRAFYDRDFIVTPDVLIPRLETEHLVEAALEWARGRDRLRVVDVGTGSGVIALTLAKHLPFADVIACDVSESALDVARRNANGLANISFIRSDLLDGVPGRFDLICANLPYIATAEMLTLDVSRYEPHLALDGGVDGLDPMRRLITAVPDRLNRPGLLLMEHGADQGAAMLEFARSAFPANRSEGRTDTQIEILQDYGRLDRILKIRLD